VDVPPLLAMYTTRFPAAPCQTHAPPSALHAMDANLLHNDNCVLPLMPSVELNVPADISTAFPFTAMLNHAAMPLVVHVVGDKVHV